jgi:hypothetical protein
MDRGLHLEAWGTTEKGYPYFRFRGVRGNVREVVLYVTVNRPAKVMFAYSIWDASTQTLTSYHGPFGNPELDELGDLEAT